MGKSEFKELKFAYYWSGIHRADIIFSQDGVFHRQKDIKTDQWSSLEILQEKDKRYELPLIEIWKHMNELQEADWSSKNIELSLGRSYQQHIEINGFVKDKKMTAQVWAQRRVKCPIDLIILDNQVIGFIYTKRDGCIILVKPGYEDLTPLKYWI